MILIFSVNIYADNHLNFEPYYKDLAPGETYQAEYSFNIAPRIKNIYIIRPNNATFTPGPIFSRLDGEEYIYFYIPTDFVKGEYRLIIKSQHIINGILKELVYEENFTISEYPGLRIKTPLIRIEDKEFKVGISNLANQIINVKPLKNNFSIAFRDFLELRYFEEKDLIYKVIRSDFDLEYLEIDSGFKLYKVPVIGGKIKEIKPKEEIKHIIEEPEEAKELIKFLTKGEMINVSIKSMESKSGFVKFEALDNISDVEVFLSGNVKEIVNLNISDIGNLLKNQEYYVSLEINKKRDAFPGFYDGFLNILYKSGSANMGVYVNVLGEVTKEVEKKPEIEELPIAPLVKPKVEKKAKPIDVRYLIVAFLILGIIVYIFYSIGKRPYKPKSVKEVYKKYRK